MEPRFNTIRMLYTAYVPYRNQIFFLALLGFISSILAGVGIGAIIPLLSFLFVKKTEELTGFAQSVSDAFSYFHIPYSIEYVLGLMIFIFVARAAILFLFNYTSARVRADYKVRTAGELLKYFLSSKWKFYISQKAGFVQDIILRDVDTSAKLLEAFAQMMLAFTSASILLVFLFFISPTITLFSVVIAISLIVVFRPLMKKIRQVGREGSVKNKAVTQYMIEHTLGMKTVKTSGVEDSVLHLGFLHFLDRQRLELKRSILASLSTVSIEPMSIFFIALVFGFSYSLTGFNFEIFAAAIILVQRIFIYLQSGQASLHIINDAIPYALHAIHFKDELSLSQEKEGDGRKFQFEHELRFEHVSFSFHKSLDPLLSDFVFSIKKGEMVGLIGPSGSGKTSAADLIMRLIRPTKGSIILDGFDSASYDLKDWRTKIGYVSQDVFLLNDTIEKNIRFYHDDIIHEEIIEAAKKAHIYEFISQLKEGFHTMVGDRGVLLSGGQRQRIALARVLARKPEILILDEATSALDNESETLIQKAIESLKGTVTVLIIAHRLSTVSNMDRIVVLDRGTIVEEGIPKNLMANQNSYFYRMYHLKEIEHS